MTWWPFQGEPPTEPKFGVMAGETQGGSAVGEPALVLRFRCINRDGGNRECYLNTSCLSARWPSSMNLDDRHFLQELGFQLRELRLARQMTQEELAQQCELHRTFIGSVERGERNLSILNLRLIARALRVPRAELFAMGSKEAKRGKAHGKED